MNNFNYSLEIDKINSQMGRAEIQKKRLIRNINREYELYLKLVRDLLYISVEKGVNELCSDPSIKDVFFSADEFFSFFDKKIGKLINSKLPFLTLEQLKIDKLEKNINNKLNFNSLGRSLKIKDELKDEFQYKNGFPFEEPFEFQISEDISNTSEYYQVENYEKIVSFDLDKNEHINYSPNNNSIESIGLEKQFISSLLELIEGVKFEKTSYHENPNIKKVDISSNQHSLENFDLIDISLENLLLNLSYKINQELFKANIIKKMISKNSFEYLVGKRLMIKHPHPFIINFELNLNNSSSNVHNFPSIMFLNISIVELEFKNLNLSIQRNKINDLKNQFQRLIKKETYWRQKEITLNKIR